MLSARIQDGNSLHIGERFFVMFQRTLRIPDDGRDYPLPPGLGPFPLHRVDDYAARVPAHWRERGGFFLPMYQREAMWLDFRAESWKPNAVKIGIGNVNAVSGKPWDEKLRAKPQDYVVCPDQPWLDGINAGDGFIRQFVAMPLGEGYTVEAQVTGKEEFGGLQIVVFEPKPGKFPDEPPPSRYDEATRYSLGAMLPMAAPMVAEMGLGAGGKMKQQIYPDPHGIETWDTENRGSAFVHIVNSEQYETITRQKPPPSPISAELYTQHGLPWFDLYDEDRGDLKASKKLAKVKSVQEIEAERGLPSQEDDASVEIDPAQLKVLYPETSKKEAGT
jgi:hypothetical protein